MADFKSSLKNSLHAVHLYEPVHQIWSHRPNLRMMLWNFGYRTAGFGDHLPIPPAKLIHFTINSSEISWFLHSGAISFDCLSNALERNQYSLGKFHNVLDFGCGCGRVLRFWHGTKGVHKFGSDYNPELIHWAQSHLNRVADFQTNLLAPPLNYPDNFFDFVYSLSVFTHLPEDLQDAWMDELFRVLEPNGLLLITLHGRSRAHVLDQEQKARFLEGQMVVIHEEAAGANLCGSYHPVEYVKNRLARKFELVDFIESGARDSNQDIYLLRKPISK